MNKFVIIFLLCVTALQLTACSQSNEPVSALTIHNDGRVDARVTEVLDKDYYDEVALQEWINLEIQEYNSKSTESLVTFEKLLVTNDEAWLTMKYATANDYMSFNNEVLFFGTYEEAIGAGFSFKGTFKDKENESILFTEEDFMQFAGKNVLIVEEPIRVIVSSQVSFWTEDVTLVEDRKFDMNTLENEDYAILIFE